MVVVTRVRGEITAVPTGDTNSDARRRGPTDARAPTRSAGPRRPPGRQLPFRQVTDAIKTRPPRGRTTRPGNAYLARRVHPRPDSDSRRGGGPTGAARSAPRRVHPTAQQRRWGLTVRTMEMLGRTGGHQLWPSSGIFGRSQRVAGQRGQPVRAVDDAASCLVAQAFDVATCRRTASPTMAEVTVRYPVEQRTRSPIRRSPARRGGAEPTVGARRTG